MWLINVETRLLKNFSGGPDRIPPYAILSHTWEDGQEVIFQEMCEEPEIDERRGWEKIHRTCLQAAQDGLHYAWVDTCCIDKSSSAELTEAINSMFNWYKRSSRCYVYLSDLSTVPSPETWATDVKHCRWFTRGWTLQELIAPAKLKFYNSDWEFCFNKSDASEQLSETTGITLGILGHTEDLSTVSVAQKMSWASLRQTTRIEDTAYCLLGIFDINMPLLYGEEEKAFERLQAEIIRTCPDPSIFSWVQPDGALENPHDLFTGVLAPSPKSFGNAGEIKKVDARFIPDYTTTNRGIKLKAKFSLGLIKNSENEGSSGLVLPVCRSNDETLRIHVRNIGYGTFVRQNPTALIRLRPYGGTDTLMLSPFLLTHLPPSRRVQRRDFILAQRIHSLKINLAFEMSIYRRWPWQKWDDVDTIFFGSDDPQCWAAIKVLAVPPKFDDVPRGDILFLFYALGWSSATGSKPICGLHRISGSLADRQLEDMNDRAVAEGWDAYLVGNRLRMSDVPRHHMIPAALAPENKALVLRFSLDMTEDEGMSTSRFWKVNFFWDFVPSKKVENMVDYGWD